MQAIARVLFLIGAVLLWRQQSHAADEDVAERGRGQRFLPVAGMALRPELLVIESAITEAPARTFFLRTRSRAARQPGHACAVPGTLGAETSAEVATEAE